MADDWGSRSLTASIHHIGSNQPWERIRLTRQTAFQLDVFRSDRPGVAGAQMGCPTGLDACMKANDGGALNAVLSPPDDFTLGARTQQRWSTAFRPRCLVNSCPAVRIASPALDADQREVS